MAMKRKGSAPEGNPERNGNFRVDGNTTLDVDALRQIVEILEASEVTRLVWNRGEERLAILRQPPGSVAAHPGYAAPSVTVVSSAPSPAPAPSSSGPASAAAPAAAAKPGHMVTSPFVGTFYRSPSPDQPSFVEVGSLVKKGQVLCIIEAMKLMNEIESEVEGKVAEALVENGTPVEFGQALFRIEKA